MNNTLGIIVGIDASRNRSGGAKAHLIGILGDGDPIKYGIREVHLWASASIMDSIPNYSWLVIHNPNELRKSLSRQLYWQATNLLHEVTKARCDILFTTDASTLCRFRPMVILSQDMLSYEPGIMRLFGYSKARLRLLTILLIQNRAFRFADGVIFLTKYASTVIQQSCGFLTRVAFIPHGVGKDFKRKRYTNDWSDNKECPITCIYVSNAALYKHQWVVVDAINKMRKYGHNINLTLVGGGSGKAQNLLEKQLNILDPERLFVQQMDFVPQKELPNILARADIFIFASGCENMPVTLVEAMAVGLPIACSNRGPMPEVLADAGVYFDPEDADSIADAVEQIIKDPKLRERISKRAMTISDQYSWQRCGNETWKFIVDTYRSTKNE